MTLFKALRVTNYRSIEDTGTLRLGPVTLVTGRNNSGKSALLRAIYCMQDGAPLQPDDIRVHAQQMTVELLSDRFPDRIIRLTRHPSIITDGYLTYRFDRNRQQRSEVRSGEHFVNVTRLPGKEPDNLIFPVLSSRRVTFYREQASNSSAFNVSGTDNNLVSRVMQLSASHLPEAVRFRDLCRNILNENFNILPGENGQQTLGLQVDRYTSIPLEAMGAGLSGTLSLLVGLSVANENLFIIEEPEDDLHPQALKALLDEIRSSSQTNQFIISTHSSIVLTRLADMSDLQIIHVKSDHQVPPTSRYLEIRDTNSRVEALQDLGYSLADLDIGEGWLIFEESSAERLIRQYLIPWFAPGLARLRTVAARGTSRVGPLFEDFREMILFTHLEPMYKHRAWVIVDGDKIGKEATEHLKLEYRDWPADRFLNWTEGQFELYYPDSFQERVKEAFSQTKKDLKRKAKSDLLNDLIVWIEEDIPRARAAFEDSARDVIAILRSIEAQVSDMLAHSD